MTSRPPIVCTSVVMAASVIEAIDSSLTLVNLIEAIGVPQAMLGSLVGFEVVSTWVLEPEAHGVPLQAQLVTIRVGHGTRVVDDRINDFEIPPKAMLTPEGRVRLRMRAVGYQLPKEVGEYEVRMRWRRRDEKWHLSASRWFFTVAESADADEKTDRTASAIA